MTKRKTTVPIVRQVGISIKVRKLRKREKRDDRRDKYKATLIADTLGGKLSGLENIVVTGQTRLDALQTACYELGYVFKFQDRYE